MAITDSVPATFQPPDMRAEFDASMEATPNGQIIVIKPDEYNLLAGLSHEDARDLPDGLYVMDEAIRERLHATGVDYDSLNRGVLLGIDGTAAEPDTDGMLKLGRQNSAHQVFFGSLELDEPGDDLTKPKQVLVAIKRHHEMGDVENALSAKPFREVANLALMQTMGVEGAYRPVGVLQSGENKFTITELRPGVRTLDEHVWLGKRGNLVKYRHADKREVAELHERDSQIISSAFRMFGALHAQGVFHGDAQAKNVGWVINGDVVPEADAGRLTKVSDVENIKMTVVDMENATIFSRENGDFPEEYYDRLTILATTDLGQFFGSIPKTGRMPYTHWQDEPQAPEDFMSKRFIMPYLDGFVSQRMALMGETEVPQQLVDRLMVSVTERLRQLNNMPPTQTKPSN